VPAGRDPGISPPFSCPPKPIVYRADFVKGMPGERWALAWRRDNQKIFP